MLLRKAGESEYWIKLARSVFHRQRKWGEETTWSGPEWSLFSSPDPSMPALSCRIWAPVALRDPRIGTEE